MHATAASATPRPSLGAGPLARRGQGTVDLGREHDERGVVELVLGHPDVDPGHVADRQPVGAVERAAQLDVDALGLQAGGQEVRRERAGDPRELAHRDHASRWYGGVHTEAPTARSGVALMTTAARSGGIDTVKTSARSASRTMLRARVARRSAPPASAHRGAKKVSTKKYAKTVCRRLHATSTTTRSTSSIDEYNAAPTDACSFQTEAGSLTTSTSTSRGRADEA